MAYRLRVTRTWDYGRQDWKEYEDGWYWAGGIAADEKAAKVYPSLGEAQFMRTKLAREGVSTLIEAIGES